MRSRVISACADLSCRVDLEYDFDLGNDNWPQLQIVLTWGDSKVSALVPVNYSELKFFAEQLSSVRRHLSNEALFNDTDGMLTWTIQRPQNGKLELTIDLRLQHCNEPNLSHIGCQTHLPLSDDDLYFLERTVMEFVAYFS